MQCALNCKSFEAELCVHESCSGSATTFVGSLLSRLQAMLLSRLQAVAECDAGYSSYTMLVLLSAVPRRRLCASGGDLAVGAELPFWPPRVLQQLHV